MTDKKSDSENTKPASAPTATPVTPPKPSEPAKAPIAAAAAAPKSGRGLAGFALLVALGAAGGSGYLWYLWQQNQAAQAGRLDAAIKQAIAQHDPEFQALRTQVQQLQGFKASIDQARAENQDIKSQILGLTGDVQPLKNAIELQKGENEILKGEMKLLRESQDTYKTSVQTQQQELDAQLREQQGRAAKLDEQVKNLRLTDAGLAENLGALQTAVTKGGDVNAFPLAEVDYLLRLADTKLKLERNVPAARLALDTAQARLKAVDENALASVQTMLGEAIGSLRGVKLPDFSSLAHKLVDMQKQVGALPIKLDSGVPDIKDRVKPNADVAISADADRSWWDRSTEAVWKQFRDIVVIRRVRSEAPPLIAMEEEFFLRQNLRLELETMRMALLRGDAQAYQDSHELVETWLNTYFDTQDSRTTAFRDELQALRTVQFNPYIPDLTGLNQTFREAMARRQPIRAVQKAPAPAAEQPATGKEAQP
ncbi:MAG TPA: uroporphyrinogen-III C-methyltransferase [Candidatus Competibacter sp.]|nr:uroporphyrinogen-III C-methyltransferase [Candidatus Competibacter sp.]